MKGIKLLIALLCAAALWGQTATGSLSGRIADSRGQGVANAVILLTDTATQESRRVVTGADGSFSLALPPGTYRVEVESAGVRRAGTAPVEIIAGAPAQIEMTLDATPVPPGVVGTVEIRAVAPLLQTESAEVARAYGSQTVRSLPVLDRQQQEFIGLMPGITPPEITADRVEDPQRRRIYNVNGQPEWANLHNQDGAHNNEPFNQNMARVAPVVSIESLHVRSSNYNAEYGFAGGSWANTVTRPGANDVHGSLFYFNTNNFFTARNPLNFTGDDPRFTQHQFGASVGLPVIPDRMFGLLSYEGLARRGRELRITTLPTALLRAGDFSEFPGVTLFDPATGDPLTGAGRTALGTTIPAGRIDPAAAAFLGQLPLPNQPGVGNNFVGGQLLEDDTHRFDGKLDHRFSDRSYGFARYGFTHSNIDRGSLLGALGEAANAGLRNHNAVGNLSHTFGNNMIGEFRFGYTRYRNALTPTGDAAALAGFFPAGVPHLAITGLGEFGLPGNYPSRAISNSYNPATNWVWHTGLHRLKFGVDIRHLRSDGFDAGFFSPRGTFRFGPGATASPDAVTAFNPAANALAGFLLGAPTVAGVASFPVPPSYRQTLYAGYLTDTINLWQRLYLELGVRYDVFSPLEPRDDGGAVVYDPLTNTLAAVGANGLDRRGGVNYDRNNIAPRLGLAFRPVDRMVLRGGYGIHYFPVPFSRSAVNPLAAGLQTGLAGGFGTVPFTVPAATPLDPGAAPNFPFYVRPSEDLHTPYIQTFSLLLQGDLGRGFLADIGYVGTLGRQLPYSRVLAAAPGAGLGDLPGFTAFGRTAPLIERGTGLTNNYNSLQVNLTKRLSGGLAFSGAYTFSKALDRGFELLHPFDFDANYGPADGDRTHVLAISHLWQFPFGRDAASPWARMIADWELNGILRWSTGTPFTVTADPLFCCPGVAAVPANGIGDVRQIDGGEIFDTSLFAAPAPGALGDLGRNRVRGPDLFTYDLSLFRNFSVRDNLKFELRGEAYNLTNSANYGTPVATIGAPGFGRSLTTFSGRGGRQFQVAGRLLF